MDSISTQGLHKDERSFNNWLPLLNVESGQRKTDKAVIHVVER